jgi:DNA-directed RNA polymerase specialized sigma24 family protein
MNIRFRGHDRLMMFCLLPEEVVARTELTDFPREPYKALDDPHWREVYESDYFDLVLCDTWAWLVWDYLGIRGGMEKYSGFDPFWRMAHTYLLWIQAFNKMGLTAERYFANVTSPGDKMAYLTHELVAETTCNMVEFFIKHSNFSKWLEAVKEHRAHEDYDARRSSVTMDFHRQWYHTRAKVKVLDFIQVDEPSYYPYDNIDSRLDVERFTKRLDYKNQKIVKLLLAGYTQAEIAQRLGFANHSGVCKRIKKIGEAFLEYIKPQ